MVLEKILNITRFYDFATLCDDPLQLIMLTLFVSPLFSLSGILLVYSFEGTLRGFMNYKIRQQCFLSLKSIF